jgi:hypothetical protein
MLFILHICWSQRPRGLRHTSAAAWLLVRIPLGTWVVCLLCLYVVLSCISRGLCDGLITHPEESHCVSNSVWLRNLKGGGQGPSWAVTPLDGWILHISFILPCQKCLCIVFALMHSYLSFCATVGIIRSHSLSTLDCLQPFFTPHHIHYCCNNAIHGLGGGGHSCIILPITLSQIICMT